MFLEKAQRRRFLENLTWQDITDIFLSFEKVHKIWRNLRELERIWIILRALESKLQIRIEGSKRRADQHITSWFLRKERVLIVHLVLEKVD